jgi:hypothetical protein
MAGDCVSRGDRTGREGGPLGDPFRAFFLRHRWCGELATGADQGHGKTVTVWISCSCGDRVEETAPHRDSNYRPEVQEIISLDAFYLEHRGCGERDSCIEKIAGRAVVRMSCSCGARIVRPIDGGDPLRAAGDT